MDLKPQLNLCLPFRAHSRFFSKVLPLVSILCAAVVAAPAAAYGPVPAMYVFGDSLADVGTNNYLPGSRAVANFPPYGVDYPGGIPTGRFSNGYIFVDFLAMKMGFPESPPPALAVVNTSDGKVLSAKEEFRGLNFASGGSGILDSTNPNDSLSLATQVDLFAKVVAGLVATKGKPAVDADLSRSPFIFSTGVNDLAIYLGPLLPSSANSSSNASSSLPPSQVYVSRMIDAYRVQLRRIYELGARKFVFIGAAKTGCVPGVRAATAGGSCLESFDATIRLFNEAVQDMLEEGLTKDDDDEPFSAHGFQYSVTNVYRLLSTILANPLAFGMTEVKKACCGLGTFSAGGGCLPNTTNFCSDRGQHLFWDVSHPSTTTAKLIADYGFSGPPKFAYPINIAQLLYLDN